MLKTKKKQTRTACAKNCLTAVLKYVDIYLQTSTFHGMNHIQLYGKRHWIEALFWFCTLITFGAGAVWTIFQSYQRYLANPTVITLDKSYSTWNITFPATTFCFVDKFDQDKAAYLVERKWGVKNGSKFNYYMKFLNVLSNSSYYNLGSFQEYQNDTDLLKEDLSSLMAEVSFEVKKLSPTLFKKKTYYFFQVMLEMGICYSVSSAMTAEFIPKRKSENFILDEPLFCEYFHGTCFGMVEELPREATVYVHSPSEVPIAASTYHTLYYLYHLELAYNQFDIKASAHVRRLGPKQRRCYFSDEPIQKSMKFYSFNACIMHCRRLLAMKLCNCVPHFYKAEEGQPTCNIQQLSCIHKKSSELLSLSQKKNQTEKSCSCYPSCEDSYVVFDYESISKHDLIIGGYNVISTRYRWAVEKYSRTRYKRDILFGVDELIVSFGGTACFFLGGSLMSGIELIYFFSLRLIRHNGWRNQCQRFFRQSNFYKWILSVNPKSFNLGWPLLIYLVYKEYENDPKRIRIIYNSTPSHSGVSGQKHYTRHGAGMGRRNERMRIKGGHIRKKIAKYGS